jgi:hypothetical protein
MKTLFAVVALTVLGQAALAAEPSTPPAAEPSTPPATATAPLVLNDAQMDGVRAGFHIADLYLDIWVHNQDMLWDLGFMRSIWNLGR